MNPDPSKLRQQQQQDVELHIDQETGAAQEFDSAEAMIRFDARQTELPPAITERLKESIAREPKPLQPWWRRLFSRGA